MSRRRLLDHILRLLEYCTFFVTPLAFSSLDKKNLVICVPYKKERWKPTKLCLRNECVCGSHSGILDNIETKERVKDKSSTPTGLVRYINMAVVSWARVTVFVFRRREGRVFNRWGKGRPWIKNSPAPLSPPRPHQKNKKKWKILAPPCFSGVGLLIRNEIQASGLWRGECLKTIQALWSARHPAALWHSLIASCRFSGPKLS